MTKALTILLALTGVLLLSCNRTDLSQEMLLGVAAARIGHFEEGLAHANSCVAFAPENIDALLLQSYCQFMAETKPERRKQPLTTLLKCTYQAPERFDTWYFYGWALVEDGQLREAIEPLRQALKLTTHENPKRQEVLLLLERCYTANNLTADALRILQPLQASLPYRNWPELYNELGLLALKRNTPKSAVRFFQLGLKQAPKNEVLLQNLAITHDLYLNEVDWAKYYYQCCLLAKNARQDTAGVRQIQARLRQLALRR